VIEEQVREIAFETEQQGPQRVGRGPQSDLGSDPLEGALSLIGQYPRAHELGAGRVHQGFDALLERGRGAPGIGLLEGQPVLLQVPLEALQ